MNTVFKLSWISIFVFISCTKTEPIIIGDTQWSTNDLDSKYFSNGDEIPYISDINTWKNLQTPAWTYYENDSIKYGDKKLYNWYAVNDIRGICPKDWKIPSMEDWQNLIAANGGEKMAAKKLKGEIGWSEEYQQENFKNNFNIYPSGNRKNTGIYNGWSISAPFWTSDSLDMINAWAVYVNAKHDMFLSNNGDKNNALLCRCVKKIHV